MLNIQKKLILIELNEINFDIVIKYIEENPVKYKFLKKLNSLNRIRTIAEKKYEEIEPWIQWTSIHTGLSYKEHRIYRLGDIVGSKIDQIFEIIESRGYRVGVICALNAENRLKNPSYFIPDPWTKTHSGKSFLEKKISNAISQAVNDNAEEKITTKSTITLIVTVMWSFTIKYFYYVIKLIMKNEKWNKALILDILLHNLHLKLLKIKEPNFSTIFFNSGAHIQHHYLANSKPIKEIIKFKNPKWYVSENKDPIADALEVYNKIIGDYLSLENTEIIVATGLTQKPCDKIKFYYRLKNHENFLGKIGIKFKNIQKLMSRDFIINFSSEEEANIAKNILEKISIIGNGILLFGIIDKRGLSLFVTLTYPEEITKETLIQNENTRIFIYPHIVFVAIKNGMHANNGFMYCTNGIEIPVKKNELQVKEINNLIKKYFNNTIY